MIQSFNHSILFVVVVVVALAAQGCASVRTARAVSDGYKLYKEVTREKQPDEYIFSIQ